MADERTLDEALDEIDQWSEKMNEELASLSADERVEYFRRFRLEWEKKNVVVPAGRAANNTRSSSRHRWGCRVAKERTVDGAVEYSKQVDQQWEKRHPPPRGRQASSRSSASALRAQRRKKAV